MERPRATWTDERLDDLARRMDDGFDRVDEDLRALRTGLSGRIDTLEARHDARFNALDARLDSRFDTFETRQDVRFSAVEGRIEALQRTIVQVGGGLTVAVLATLLSVILTRT